MSLQYYDSLETRDPEARLKDQISLLKRQIAHAKMHAPAQARILASLDPADIRSTADLRHLPLLRKSALALQQAEGREDGPFGGYAACGWAALGAKFRAKRVFQSPGPIYEPQGDGQDSMRAGRALFAAGFRAGDLVHNSFSYHLTPAGAMMEDAAFALGCTVFPAGVGNSELQLNAMFDLRPNAYTGTPGFLKTLVETSKKQGKRLSIRKALLSGEAFPPSMRDWLLGEGIAGYQCYASADLGLIAYETEARGGLVVDEGVLVELLNPASGEPVAPGEVGEVVVTTLNADYPLLRFATGDLSSELEERCPTGRTNMRIKGWLGRADQATKIRGMFVHPVQMSEIVRRHPEVLRARLVVEGAVTAERMVLHAETGCPSSELASALVSTVRGITKLRAEVLLVAPGELMDDGKLIDDRRSYD
jgi:phenylacetate-CoA ligase